MCSLCGTVEEFVVSKGAALTAFTEVSRLGGEAKDVCAYLRLSTTAGREIMVRVYRPEALRSLSRTLRQMADDADRLRNAQKPHQVPLARVTVIP
jgi:hypothetical protein